MHLGIDIPAVSSRDDGTREPAWLVRPRRIEDPDLVVPEIDHQFHAPARQYARAGVKWSVRVEPHSLDETAERCRDRLAIIEVDDVRVRGRKDVVTVHTVLGESDLIELSWFPAFRSAFMEMRAHYRQGEWDRAGSALETCRMHNSDPRLESLIGTYDRRITAMKGRSPLENWNGVFADARRSAPGV